MKKHFPLVMLVAVNLIIGLLAVPGFGESEDELSLHWYGEKSIQLATSLLGVEEHIVKESPRQGSHGSAFIMVVVILRNLFLPHGATVEKLHFSHYLYFITFQVGIVSLYFLARRWVTETAAFGTALLFNTQPLLMGHAFINAVDIAFMSLLIASAVLGLQMVDHDEKIFPVTGRLLPDSIRLFFRQFLRTDVWLAGLLLGFSSAIRIAAPLIGIAILGYILVCRKWQRLPRFFAYGLIAFFFMVVFWPYLWPDPIGRLIQAISTSANYPDVHLTLFRGIVVEARQTPRSYVPVLLAVQLTETTLLLILVGTVAILKKLRWDLIVLILIWFGLPIIALVGMRVNLFNNFRHVFFILPPLFLLAGIGLNWLLTLVSRPLVSYLALFLMLLPGLYANITLYPYQYIYYNQIVGGVRGAYRVFELDYWNLAFKEAQSYINQNADANANVFAGGSKQTAETFARDDLVFNAFGTRKKNLGNYDYLIVSTAGNSDESFAKFPTVFVVRVQGVPLAYVKATK